MAFIKVRAEEIVHQKDELTEIAIRYFLQQHSAQDTKHVQTEQEKLSFTNAIRLQMKYLFQVEKCEFLLKKTGEEIEAFVGLIPYPKHNRVRLSIMVSNEKPDSGYLLLRALIQELKQLFPNYVFYGFILTENKILKHVVEEIGAKPVHGDLIDPTDEEETKLSSQKYILYQWINQ